MTQHITRKPPVQGGGRDPEIVPEGAGLLGELQFEGRQVPICVPAYCWMPAGCMLRQHLWSSGPDARTCNVPQCHTHSCPPLSPRSELSYSDDKLSLASAGTASTAGGTSSKLAPLLFVKDEYRGAQGRWKGRVCCLHGVEVSRLCPADLATKPTFHIQAPQATM